MKRIQEVIVVEGRHDTARLKKWFDCDTIETGGTSLSDAVLAEIRIMQKERGVIIFTDPDAPGNMIRQRINAAVPGCLNAYVQKEDARTSRKVGVEHADEAAVREALEHLITMDENRADTLGMQDMFALGLIGADNSTDRRRKAARKLHIGYGRAKTMRRRLNALGLSKEQLQEILDE